jgi:hypothetical protein
MRHPPGSHRREDTTLRLLRVVAPASTAVLFLGISLIAVPLVAGDNGTPVTATDAWSLAPPELPYSPYGTVKIGSRNVNTGTLICAWCGGVRVAETLSEFAHGQSGYGLDIQRDDSATPEKDGCVASEVVTFTVGLAEADANKPDSPGEPVVWVSGESEQVDLAVEVEPIYLPLVLR